MCIVLPMDVIFRSHRHSHVFNIYKLLRLQILRCFTLTRLLLVCVWTLVCVWMCYPACVCLCLRAHVTLCFSRWLSGTPWGIKQDFPSLGVLGRMVGWWLQSFLKLSTLSLTWDLTWDLTSAWQICPDQWETSECLTMVSIERFLFCFIFLPPFLLLFWHFFSPCLVKKER